MVHLTKEDKFQLLQNVATPLWQIEEPAESSRSRGYPLNSTLFSLGGLFSCSWVLNWMYDEEYPGSKEELATVLTQQVIDQRRNVDILFFKETKWFTRNR
jgi:hypothetical protein